MGAYFTVDAVPASKEVKAAFHEVQEQARWDHGHAGYTGTIAEADGFKVVTHPPFDTLKEAEEWACNVAEKWGPALVVTVKPGKQYFMGWYSS